MVFLFFLSSPKVIHTLSRTNLCWLQFIENFTNHLSPLLQQLKEDISCSVATWGSKARMIFPTAPVPQTGWT